MIRAIRIASGLDLKTAKNIVDDIGDRGFVSIRLSMNNYPGGLETFIRDAAGFGYEVTEIVNDDRETLLRLICNFARKGKYSSAINLISTLETLDSL